MSFNSLVRTHEFWTQVQTRLKSLPALDSVLGGAGRVKMMTDDLSSPEGGDDSKPWGRVVVAPSETLWPMPDVADQTKDISWLVRVEFNDFNSNNYDVDVSVDVAMALADSLMVGWRPAGLTHILVALPVYRRQAPKSLPQWNENRGVWWKSAEYRTEVSPL